MFETADQTMIVLPHDTILKAELADTTAIEPHEPTAIELPAATERSVLIGHRRSDRKTLTKVGATVEAISRKKVVQIVATATTAHVILTETNDLKRNLGETRIHDLRIMETRTADTLLDLIPKETLVSRTTLKNAIAISEATSRTIQVQEIRSRITQAQEAAAAKALNLTASLQEVQRARALTTSDLSRETTTKKRTPGRDTGK